MNNIFVFGSNEKGIHGKGAAFDARLKHGAIYGQGVGLQGNSYAIPTKATPYITLPLTKIEAYVKDFLVFAAKNPHLTFNVTRLGCGLAGYKDVEIGPMFKGATKNCILPSGWGV